MLVNSKKRNRSILNARFFGRSRFSGDLLFSLLFPKGRCSIGCFFHRVFSRVIFSLELRTEIKIATGQNVQITNDQITRRKYRSALVATANKPTDDYVKVFGKCVFEYKNILIMQNL